jgi:hypothetical protein
VLQVSETVCTREMDLMAPKCPKGNHFLKWDEDVSIWYCGEHGVFDFDKPGPDEPKPKSFKKGVRVTKAFFEENDYAHVECINCGLIHRIIVSISTTFTCEHCKSTNTYEFKEQ